MDVATGGFDDTKVRSWFEDKHNPDSYKEQMREMSRSNDDGDDDVDDCKTKAKSLEGMMVLGGLGM